MFKCIKPIIFTFFTFLIITFFSINVDATEITSINNLIEDAKEFDKQEVIVKGEAIGEKMARGHCSWININDSTNAIGIWMNNNDAEKVKYFGSYKYKGDTIKINGTFHRACLEHGGEADIHCNSIEIVKNGSFTNEQISSNKIITTILLLPIAILFLLYFKCKIKKS